MNSPNNQADAVEPALPGAMRRPLQGETALHEAQRSENDRGVPSVSWPLALAFICLIVYASLYPFTDWRNQGISPLVYLTAPLPKYWTGFDVAANVVGYAPLGFLLTLASLRSGLIKWAMLLAVLGAFVLSLALETLQSYLPSRIPSNVDLALNTLGAAVGAYIAWALEKQIGRAHV